MPSGVPTCAARVIRNNFLEYGWGATLTNETNQMVKRVSEDASAMYRMQTSRKRPVDSISLSSALFWEHRHLIQQRIVSTPRVICKTMANDDLELFCREKKYYKEALKKLNRKFSSDLEEVSMHPVFGPMREREFVLWPICIDEVFVTIILRTGPKSAAGQDPQQYFDREVIEYAIIDPLPKKRDSRRTFVFRRLQKILAEGCIDFPSSAVDRNFVTRDIEEEWATGHVAFAISREFIRRLKVLLYRRQLGRIDAATDFLWDSFEEHYNIDSYRESIMAACAHQTIEKSGYLVRMAIEVPSPKSNHKAEELSHLLAKSVISAPEVVPDELYKSSADFTVVVQIPEEMRKGEVTVPQQQRDYGSDESEPESDQELEEDSVEDESDEDEPMLDDTGDISHNAEPIRESIEEDEQDEQDIAPAQPFIPGLSTFNQPQQSPQDVSFQEADDHMDLDDREQIDTDGSLFNESSSVAGGTPTNAANIPPSSPSENDIIAEAQGIESSEEQSKIDAESRKRSFSNTDEDGSPYKKARIDDGHHGGLPYEKPRVEDGE
ncbi:hypothetical protein F4677DRAFT_262400 [Hypoxylon crocopeplum]|nr:hypothetical protein F4677DRAFT_262400 [Hypoxylon crocopeplum]